MFKELDEQAAEHIKSSGARSDFCFCHLFFLVELYVLETAEDDAVVLLLAQDSWDVLPANGWRQR